MMGARALASAIATHELSCAEVMEAYLGHIAAINPAANAIVALRDGDALMAEAREKDASLARGEKPGPLFGLPHAVKDTVPVKGIRSTWGTPILKDLIPSQDAPMVERLRTAGASIIGKTNTPEFALGSHTYNPIYGATPNPYDAALSAGGSTGGGAAALALRMLPLADGSDYGGSLRNPAGWNNVCGFRPSYGVVPAPGEEAWLPSLSVNGPMARDIGDLALLLSVQAGHDPRAPLSLPGDGSRFLGSLDTDVKDKRIGWLGSFNGWAPYETGVLELCEDALNSFAAAGAIIEPALPQADLDAAWQAFLTIRHWQQGTALRPWYTNPQSRALLKPEAIFEVEGGTKLSAFDVSAASVARTVWYNAFARLFARFDVLAMPTSQVFAFDIAQPWPKEIAGQTMRSYHEWMKATCLVSLSGCPSLAVPAGFDARGRAMGIQLIAPVQRDLDCLKLGNAFQQTTGKGCMQHLPPALAA